MAKKENVESLDLLLQDLCDNTEIFGGKVIVFGGDFRQVLPVLPHRTQHEAVCASLVTSYLWPKLTKFRLTHNIRAKDDPVFCDFLLQLGNGNLQRTEKAFIEFPLNISQCVTIDEHCLALLISHVFPEILNPVIDASIFSSRAILFPTNEDADTINAALIEKFAGTPFTYKSVDSVTDDNCNIYPSDFLHVHRK